ncbi:MAG TPA: VTT domain-containing protein [Terriglobales bacterium]|jgi:membrane protein DedA with SNARE-associated domain|nr:VTT domain-containing protein [Terriglobales bacterium]
MEAFLAAIGRHGYILVFVIVLAEALGMPVPAALALVAAGAAAAAGLLRLPILLLLSISAMLIGDALLFVLGRYMGWGLLGFLCKLSVNPETCILRSAESFYKRGKATLLFAKFIPGINTMAPPLAGSMKMRPDIFLRLDLAGASLYAIVYIAVGYVFRDFLASLAHGFQTAGRAVESVTVFALIAYAGYRIWLYRKNSIYRVVPRVQVEELARRLASEEKDKVLLMDVRSHGYYDSGAARIKGSIRIEPNNLADEVKTLPRDKDIYVYCT